MHSHDKKGVGSIEHDHVHRHTEPPPEIELRIKAMESLLVEMGVVDPVVIDAIVDTYERKIGPRNGARVVAKAWSDPIFRERLLSNPAGAIAELGMAGIHGENLVMVENTSDVHNVIVCTLCSCYPWQTLGLPPLWFKSAAYRSRVVADPRAVLSEFGLTFGEEVSIRVWDSNADVRYMVLPQIPVEAEGLPESELVDLVTRDSMIGTGTPYASSSPVMNTLHDLGGMAGFGPLEPTPEGGSPFHSDAERGAFRVMMGAMAAGWGDADGFRAAVEALPAEMYIQECFPANYLAGLEVQLAERGLISKEMLDAYISGEPFDLLPIPEKKSPVPTSISKPLTARFTTGDRVRVRLFHAAGHTRSPRYLRGQTGVIKAERGIFDLPDALAARIGHFPQPLYTVAFTAKSIWGERASPNDLLHADLYDSYLEPHRESIDER